MATAPNPSTVFTHDFAQLAREVAMDILPLGDILKMHRLTDLEWQRISEHPKFIAMLENMTREWNSALNTPERTRVKAATGIEAVLEVYIRDITDSAIPLAQRVEAGKFLARLGELDGSKASGGAVGGGFAITINIGDVHKHVQVPAVVAKVIEHEGGVL